MKLLHFIENGQNRLGVKTDQGIIDVAKALAMTEAQGVPQTLQEVFDGGQAALKSLEQFALQASERGGDYVLDENGLTLGPCVAKPGKIICVGLNYRAHAEESGAKVPETPLLFSKFSNTLTGHGRDIPLPKGASNFDYEAELVIVIGKTAKNVSKESALDYVFGYCNGNDVSARDLQFRTSQWLLGKSCDHFCPIGPYLVTADEAGNPNALNIRCIMNGEVRQNSNTSDMIFPCDEIVSYASQYMTLEPGDIIMTGTPSGVILGYPEDKRVFLKAGDIVTVEIEGLGALTNRFVAEA